MIDFQEGFITPQQAASRSSQCTAIVLEQLLADPEYVKLQSRKARRSSRLVAIKLSLACLVAATACIVPVVWFSPQEVTSLNQGALTAMPSTDYDYKPPLPGAPEVFTQREAFSEKAIMPVDHPQDSDLQNEPAQHDDTGFADGDVLVDEEQLHPNCDCVGFTEDVLLAAYTVEELDVMDTIGSLDSILHASEDHVVSYYKEAEVSTTVTDTNTTADSELLGAIEQLSESGLIVTVGDVDVTHGDPDVHADEQQHYQSCCLIGAGVFAVLLVVQQLGSPLNLLTRAHNALKGACAKLGVTLTKQATLHEQQQHKAQQQKHTAAQHALPVWSSEDLLAEPPDSRLRMTHQAWPWATKEPSPDGGGTWQGGWQVTAYRGLRGAPAGAGALLPLGTAAATPPPLLMMGTAPIQVMPAAYSWLMTRLASSVSSVREGHAASMQLQALANEWQLVVYSCAGNMESFTSMRVREAQVLEVLMMALREAASSSSSCLTSIGSSNGLIGSSTGLTGIQFTAMGVEIALIGGLSAKAEDRAWRPAQIMSQATTPASHRQPTPSRVISARSSPFLPVAVARQHGIRSPTPGSPTPLLQLLVHCQIERAVELLQTADSQALPARQCTDVVVQSRLPIPSRCEAKVQTDMAEGTLEQGQGIAAQTGMVAELHEQIGKLEASLASERAATAAANLCLREAELRDRRSYSALHHSFQAARADYEREKRAASTSAREQRQRELQHNRALAELQHKLTLAEQRYSDAAQLELTAQQETVRAEEHRKEAAGHVAEAEIRAGHLDFKEAGLNNRETASMARMSEATLLQRQCEEQVQILKEQEEEQHQQSRHQKEQLDKRGLDLDARELDVDARAKKLLADTTEKKDKLKKVATSLEEGENDLEELRLSHKKHADLWSAQCKQERADLAKARKDVEADRQQHEEKCKAELQRLKDEVQQLSATLKTQEQQSQHQLAEKDRQHGEQLQQQRQALLGPSASHQVQGNSVAAWLTSHGLHAVSAVQIASELQQMHAENERQKQLISQTLEVERQRMAQQLEAGRQVMLQQLAAEKQELASHLDAELDRLQKEVNEDEAVCSDRIKDACADAQQARLAQSAAEAGRAAAEAAKSAAEAATAQAEAAQATAETAAATAESAKTQAELERATAENALAATESARAQAEAARTTAEAAVAAAQAAAQAEQERTTAESAQAEAATKMKSSARKEKEYLKAVADAKQEAAQLAKQLQKDLQELRAEQVVMEKQQQQAHQAALGQADHNVAQAKEAAHTATAKAIASEQAKQVAEGVAAAAAADAAKARAAVKAAQQSMEKQTSCTAVEKEQLEEKLSELKQKFQAKLAAAERLHTATVQELSQKVSQLSQTLEASQLLTNQLLSSAVAAEVEVFRREDEVSKREDALPPTPDSLVGQMSRKLGVDKGYAADTGRASVHAELTSKHLAAERARRQIQYREEQESKTKKRKCCDTTDLT